MASLGLNTLKHFEDGRVLSWTQWKEQWQEANNVWSCKGLLHCGFKAEVLSAQQASERLCFYLELADGSWSKRLDNGQTVLAKKALQVLADLDSNFHDVFGEQLHSMTPEAAEAVFHFFRPKIGNEGEGLVNFETPRAPQRFELQTHIGRRLNEKLLRWCEFVWRKRYALPLQGRWPTDPSTVAILHARRVEVLDILYAYGNRKLETLLDVVLTPPEDGAQGATWVYRVQWELLFPDDCTERLYNLAFRASGCDAFERRTKVLAESLIRGSCAAKVLVLVNAAREAFAQRVR